MTPTMTFDILAGILGIIFPAYAYLNGFKIRKLVEENPEARIQIFKGTAFTLIGLGAITIFSLLYHEQHLESIGLQFIFKPLWVSLMFAICITGFWLMSKMKITPEFVQKFNISNKDILHLMPANRKEYRLMVVLSFIAGTFEEILYRGFLFWWLMNHVSIYVAVPLASLPFALAHLSTTGFRNSFMAFILGLLWTGSYLLTDSLWLAILTHILVDLYSSTQGIKVAEAKYNQQESSD